jgi:hypothetical protein
MPTRKPLTAPYVRHVEALGLLVRLDLDGTLRVRPFGHKKGWTAVISLKDIHTPPESTS